MLKQSDDYETQQRLKRTLNQNLQRPEINQSPPRLLLETIESSVCIKDTDNSLFLFSL